jgi:integrase
MAVGLESKGLLVFSFCASSIKRDLFGPDYPKYDLVIPLPDGTPWLPDRFTDAYVAFARRVGAEGIRFHDLRHTCFRVVKRRNSGEDRIYVHLLSGDEERAAKHVQKTLRKRLAK